MNLKVVLILLVVSVSGLAYDMQCPNSIVSAELKNTFSPKTIELNEQKQFPNFELHACECVCVPVRE